MSSTQCLHWLLFLISLLSSIILSASSTTVPSSPVPGTSQKYTDAGWSSSAATEISPSLAQGRTDTGGMSTSSIQADTITTEIPSFSGSSTITPMISVSPTQDTSSDLASTNSTDLATTNSTNLATTPLPVTTDVTQTIGLTTTANSPTAQTQWTSLHSSTSVPTSQSAQTTVTALVSTETINTTVILKGPHLGLSPAEASFTIFCGVLLGLTIFAIAGYSIHKWRLKKSQYTHQPLFNSSEDTVGRFSAPDDTLVISGGLYDGPEIFNPALTTDEDVGLHSDQPPFAPQPTEFRLEFLPEGQPMSTGSGAHTFETFQPFDAKA